MKRIIKKNVFSVFLLSLMLLLSSCENPLKEEVFSEIDPEAFLKTEDGLKALLAASYGEWNEAERNYRMIMNEMTTDILWETGGGLERTAVIYINFAWDPDQSFLQGVFQRRYRAIRNANSLLDNIGFATGVSQATRNKFMGEAKFVRAIAYYELYDLCGPVPMVTTLNTTNYETARPTDADFKTFLENELLETIELLPTDNQVGRATKGSAIGQLTKFYMMTKQWQKAADAAQDIIDLGKYYLFPDIELLFRAGNDNNSEYLFQLSYLVEIGNPNAYVAHAFPPSYYSLTDGSLVWQSNWTNYGAQFRTYDAFYDTFDPFDRRLRMFITEYVNSSGDTITLRGDDNIRSFKYWPDPNSDGHIQGNDIPVVRYADILLCRAEALNEINGPNQESIDLINQVRSRAAAPLLNTSEFTSTESLRDEILAERGREFFTEGLRRQDLIRHGKFISKAIERGKNALPTHVLFPIPQSEMDANPSLVQNPGY